MVTRRQNGETVAQVLELLREVGPMTRAEMSQHLQIDRRNLASVVTRMIRSSPRLPRRIHILRYVFDMEGQRAYPRAVYALGDKPDAKRPVPDTKAIKRRYNAKVRARNTANFVFNLALPRRVYENRKPANSAIKEAA